MPFTMVAFTLGSLSIIGLPPFGGVWSKWFLGLGALEADALPVLIILMISSLLSVGYLMPVVLRAFFRAPREEETGIAEAPLLCVLPLCLTALGCVALFFFADTLYDLLRPLVSGGKTP